MSLNHILGKTVLLSRMVKIEHSIFALPFAYMGAFLAAGGWPGWRAFGFLTLAMVAVRSFAMAFNRLADLKFDRENPRTQTRPLVTGEVTVQETVIFIVVTGAVFVGACAAMNMLCLAFAPLALGLSWFYSYTKRFTWLCHFVLGAVLGLSPLAGWLSTGQIFTQPAVLFALGVLFWVAGFDILYSCQDVEFDQDMGLNSLPARFGVGPSLLVSSFCHVNTALFFLMAGWAAWLKWPYYLVWAVTSIILIWEHRLVSEKDLSRITLAFFTLNGVISMAVFAGVLLAL